MSKVAAINLFFRREIDIPVEALMNEVSFVADFFYHQVQVSEKGGDQAPINRRAYRSSTAQLHVWISREEMLGV